MMASSILRWRCRARAVVGLRSRIGSIARCTSSVPARRSGTARARWYVADGVLHQQGTGSDMLRSVRTSLSLLTLQGAAGGSHGTAALTCGFRRTRRRLTALDAFLQRATA